MLIAVTVPWFSQRIKDGFSFEKNIYRFNFWIISWNVFLEHPIAGVGSGMLPGYLEPFKEKGLIDNTAHAHNLYLHALAEERHPGFYPRYRYAHILLMASTSSFIAGHRSRS